MTRDLLQYEARPTDRASYTSSKWMVLDVSAKSSPCIQDNLPLSGRLHYRSLCHDSGSATWEERKHEPKDTLLFKPFCQAGTWRQGPDRVMSAWRMCRSWAIPRITIDSLCLTAQAACLRVARVLASDFVILTRYLIHSVQTSASIIRTRATARILVYVTSGDDDNHVKSANGLVLPDSVHIPKLSRWE
jgi:hypothetical protein